MDFNGFSWIFMDFRCLGDRKFGGRLRDIAGYGGIWRDMAGYGGIPGDTRGYDEIRSPHDVFTTTSVKRETANRTHSRFDGPLVERLSIPMIGESSSSTKHRPGKNKKGPGIRRALRPERGERPGCSA